MASYLEHCQECKEKLGGEFGQVHKWLDEFFAKMGWDVKHRDIRHHEKGIEEVRKLWGDEAAKAARLHIERDFYGYVPKDEKDVQNWRLGVVHVPGLKDEGGILVPDSRGRDAIPEKKGT
jgi:hypothetical protein